MHSYHFRTFHQELGGSVFGHFFRYWHQQGIVSLASSGAIVRENVVDTSDPDIVAILFQRRSVLVEMGMSASVVISGAASQKVVKAYRGLGGLCTFKTTSTA